MFKLSKKADYGLIAVKHLATHRDVHACSANEISEEYGISTTLMAKVLQKLARHGVVAAKHGSSGGYQLAKDPGQISALDVISAIDGPVLITSCVTSHGNCDATDRCSVRASHRLSWHLRNGGDNAKLSSIRGKGSLGRLSNKRIRTGMDRDDTVLASG